MCPDLVTCAVLDAQPLVYRLTQQALTDGFGVLAELLWVGHRFVQDALLHFLVLHLDKRWIDSQVSVFT